MKGKHSLLSSFVDGPKTAADDAGQIAQGQFGVNMMGAKITDMKRVEGQTLRNYQKFGWTPRTANAAVWGAVRAGASGARSFAGVLEANGPASGSTLDSLADDNGVNLLPGGGDPDSLTRAQRRQAQRLSSSNGGSQKAISALSKGAQSGISTFMDVLNADDHFAAYYEMAYGSAKEHRKRQGGIFAAMDAFGEHEMTHFLEGRNALAKEQSAFYTKIKTSADILADVIGGASAGLHYAAGAENPTLNSSKKPENRNLNEWLKQLGMDGARATGAGAFQYLLSDGELVGQMTGWQSETQRMRWTATEDGNYRLVGSREEWRSSLVPGQPFEKPDQAAQEVIGQLDKRERR
jgi:hypothetical protein